MRPLFFAFIAASFALASCNKPRPVFEEGPKPAARVTTDPRDVDQCLAQPTLYWCRRVCDIDPNWGGCHAGH